MTADSTAHTTWEGDLANGGGSTTLGSGVAGALPVSWAARTARSAGATSPEELIAAAHASCYCMALSAGLAGAGTPPTRLDADATVTFVPGTGITGVALRVRGVVPGLDAAGFVVAAEAAKVGCPVSQALSVPITLDAALA